MPGLSAVTLHTSDNLALSAWYKPPPAGRPVIIFFHGVGADLNQLVSRMGMFDQAGWGMLFVEYRGFAGNPGRPSEAGLAKDALAGYSFLRDRHIGSSHIVLYGQSLGTGVAVELATRENVAAVVLDAPYTSIATLAGRYFLYLPVRLFLTSPFNSLTRIRYIHAPLLVLQGERDNVIPPVMGQTLYKTALAPKQFWSSPSAGHIDVLENGGLPVVVAFLKRYVPGA